MKGILVTVLSVLVVFSFVGCASSGAAADTKAADTKAAATPAPVEQKAALPAGAVELLDSFESDSDISLPWTAVGDSWDQWGAHNYGMLAQPSDQGVTEGKESLEWGFETMVPSKNKDTTKPDYPPQATYYTDQVPFTDWSDVKYIALDVFNPNKFTVQIYFSVQATDSWNWSQTKPQVAKPGKNTLIFPLDSDIFSGGTPPAPITALVGKDNIKRIMFNVCDAELQTGSVFVDNLRVIR